MPIYNLEKIYEILNEGNIEDARDHIYPYLQLFYEHCLKWKYLQNIGYLYGSSWTTTISKAFNKIKNEFYNNKHETLKSNNITANLRKTNAFETAFMKGKKEAIESTKDKQSIKNIMQDQEVLDTFNSIENIINSEFLKSWLRSYSLPQNVCYIDQMHIN